MSGAKRDLIPAVDIMRPCPHLATQSNSVSSASTKISSKVLAIEREIKPWREFLNFDCFNRSFVRRCHVFGIACPLLPFSNARCCMARELAQPGQEWSVSWTKRSHSPQKRHEQRGHLKHLASDDVENWRTQEKHESLVAGDSSLSSLTDICKT